MATTVDCEGCEYDSETECTADFCILFDDSPKKHKGEFLNPKRWGDVFHYGWGYTVCPYCGDETEWFNPMSQGFQSNYENQKREYCPKCNKRVFASENWIFNQPPIMD